jgi:hypothetical protein
MESIFKILIYVLVFSLTGSIEVQAAWDDHWTSKLELKLLIDDETSNIEKETVALTIQLINKSNDKLRFFIPESPNQLSIYVLTQRGKDLRLQGLLSWVGESTYPNKEVVIKPNGIIVFKRRFDLSVYKDEIANKTFVEFAANFVLYLNNGKTGIDSNVAKYMLPFNSEKR